MTTVFEDDGSARFVAAVEVFIFRGGRILAMRRARDSEAAAGAWDALSGRVRPGEDEVVARLILPEERSPFLDAHLDVLEIEELP